MNEKITIRIDKEDKKAIQDKAKELRVSVGDYVRMTMVKDANEKK